MTDTQGWYYQVPLDGVGSQSLTNAHCFRLSLALISTSGFVLLLIVATSVSATKFHSRSAAEGTSLFGLTSSQNIPGAVRLLHVLRNTGGSELQGFRAVLPGARTNGKLQTLAPHRTSKFSIEHHAMADDRERTDPNEVIVVCGASRGIGLEMCRQLLVGEQGHTRTVVALGRNAPEAQGLDSLIEELDSKARFLGSRYSKLLRLRCDVTDENSLVACGQHVLDLFGRVDVVINTAGVLSDLSGQIPVSELPERSLSKVNLRNLELQFRTNAFGPILLAKAFIPLLKRSPGRHSGGPPVFASLSARVGSIEDNSKGGWYSYRASKAAQNMLLKCAAIELGYSQKNPIVLLLHPGTVDTELSEPFQKQVKWELFTVERAAQQLLFIVFGTRREDNGCFLDWKGEKIPW